MTAPSTRPDTLLAQHPLVLIPDFMSDARIFEPVTRVLSRHLPVMVTPCPDGARVEEVAAVLLRQLPERFTLAGVGLGGSVAAAILDRAPDRVLGIALIAASPLAETPAKAAEREPWIMRARAGRLRGVMQEVCPAHALAPGPLRAQVMQRQADMAEDLGAELFVTQSRMLQRRGDLQAVLRRAVQPGLVICGLHDTIIPVRRQLFTAELMRQAKIEMIEDAGHLPLLEQPDRVTAILWHWLRETEAMGRQVEEEVQEIPLHWPVMQRIAARRARGATIQRSA